MRKEELQTHLRSFQRYKIPSRFEVENFSQFYFPFCSRQQISWPRAFMKWEQCTVLWQQCLCKYKYIYTHLCAWIFFLKRLCIAFLPSFAAVSAARQALFETDLCFPASWQRNPSWWLPRAGVSTCASLQTIWMLGKEAGTSVWRRCL